ncbi:chromosome partitioning protein ParB [Rodentibacter mrazii]|uniref:Chromosome partitioning protein ParB n=1 Tax=Rodentibacter mrazii TaxID=1908257 RepID=A0A1V3IFE6_9PAST|nr:ParB family protein [Rodentibacter mrazii]OOF39148.1 chromosome partitioning protein ParB [Rodentibacter mrazii]
MNNPFIAKNKKQQNQLDAIAKGLNVQPISNHSATYQATTATHYPVQSQYITVTLDKLRPYEHNPRKTRNPNFEMIKESIRRRGLDHKPNITQRPGEPFYIIADGGNTRIQALKELFTETQDQRFWSIECLYKPWKGETADSVEAELDLLIGHLIENDTRADLTFIEKALGIRQAKEYYEKKLGKALSARELSSELENDGYIISKTLISKMDLCVKYLYPFIPDVLFNGLGNAPIDKLLAIRNNALAIWQNYQFELDVTFDEIWGNSLSRCNDDQPFQVKIFQDHLIDEMSAMLGDRMSYEMLFLEIDLDEQKFKKMAQKQHEIEQNVQDSIQDVQTFNQPQEALLGQISANSEVEHAPKTEKAEKKTSTSAPVSTPSCVETTPSVDTEGNNEHEDEDKDPPESGELSEGLSFDFAKNLAQQFGITPGMTVQEQRQQRAEENGLGFACVGRQPVDDIWKVYPARQHKLEAYSLALDIAEHVGLIDYVEHVVKQPVDYTYRMKPLDKDVSGVAQMCYDFLTLLQTDIHPQTSFTLLPEYLLNTQETDDTTLVKLFRLIRLVRYIRSEGDAQ